MPLSPGHPFPRVSAAGAPSAPNGPSAPLPRFRDWKDGGGFFSGGGAARRTPPQPRAGRNVRGGSSERAGFLGGADGPPGRKSSALPAAFGAPAAAEVPPGGCHGRLPRAGRLGKASTSPRELAQLRGGWRHSGSAPRPAGGVEGGGGRGRARGAGPGGAPPGPRARRRRGGPPPSSAGCDVPPRKESSEKKNAGGAALRRRTRARGPSAQSPPAPPPWAPPPPHPPVFPAPVTRRAPCRPAAGSPSP